MLANYARKWPIMLAKIADYARQMADYAQIMLRFRCFRALRARVEAPRGAFLHISVLIFNCSAWNRTRTYSN